MSKKIVLLLIFVQIGVLFANEPELNTKTYLTSPLLNGILSTHGAQTASQGKLNLGLGLIYSDDPFVLEYKSSEAITRHILENKMEADFGFSFGIADWFDIGFVLPVNVYHGGEGYFGSDMNSFGIGDFIILPRLSLYKMKDSLFAVSILVEQTLPTGRYRDKLMGASNVTMAPIIAVSSTYEGFSVVLNVFYAKIENTIKIKQERYYQTVFYILFTLLGYRIKVEQNTNKGRMDAVIKTDSNIYIFEFKLDKTTQEAIKQIKDKKYYQKYLLDKRKLVLVGVEFSSESGEIKDWQVDGR